MPDPELDSFFAETYGLAPSGRVRSPLRVCPLGAHVDHQGGTVTGMALDVSVELAYVPDESGLVRVRSMDFPDEEYFRLDDVPGMLPGFWGSYLRGAVRSLARSYKLRRGLLGVVRGKLPMGGLSSSAAVITAYLLALCDVNSLECGPEELIALSHWVEFEFIGLKNGILDQAANVLSRSGSLMVMDCSTSRWRLAPRGDAMPDFEVVIVNSGFTKALIGTDYNNRVDECKVAACVLEEHATGAMPAYAQARLCRIPREDWERYGELLPGSLGRRARHYFEENRRVREGVAAWEAGDLRTFGRLMRESGDSSVHQYQCGCPQLITIFEALKSSPGVYGARFSGAGYRGCCIGLCDPAHREDIRRAIDSSYPAAHPEYASTYSVSFCKTADGASIESSCRAKEARA